MTDHLVTFSHSPHTSRGCYERLPSAHLPGDGLELLLAVGVERVLGLDDDGEDGKGDDGDGCLATDLGGEDVVVARVSDVCLQAVDRALALHTTHLSAFSSPLCTERGYRSVDQG